jgi:inosine/xanthosine triphosphate pyrophosphatase family protein
MAEERKPITFVTGNAGKLREVQQIIGDSIHVVSLNVDCKQFQFSLFCEGVGTFY